MLSFPMVKGQFELPCKNELKPTKMPRDLLPGLKEI